MATLGRPTSYRPEYAIEVADMCARGATDLEIADALEIDVRTLYRWKAKYDDFRHAMKLAKEVADERVERSLYVRAIGYEHDEVDIRVVNGEIVATPIRKFYPPDTAAAKFWLTNRRSDSWRDKTEANVKVDGLTELVQYLSANAKGLPIGPDPQDEKADDDER